MESAITLLLNNRGCQQIHVVHLILNIRGKEEVLSARLDDMAMPDEKETAKIFNAMISDSDVWLPVLSALHPQSSLMEHPKVLTATNAL